MTPDAQYWVNISLLALTVWREARGESYLAKLAVAYSILDRVKHPAWWGSSVMDVVGKRLQYSSMTSPGDPNLVQWPRFGDSAFNDSIQAALAATIGGAENPAPGADSYFDDSINPPSWAKPEMFVRKIDHLSFYNLDRDFEAPSIRAS